MRNSIHVVLIIIFPEFGNFGSWLYLLLLILSNMRKNISFFAIFSISIMLLLLSGSLHVANTVFSTPVEIINSTGDGI